MKTILLPLVMLAILCIGACKPPETKPKAAPKDAKQKPADAGAKSAAAQTWDFEDAETGSLPKGWTVAKTGEGPGGEWQVLEDDSAPAGSKVLGQVSTEAPSRCSASVLQTKPITPMWI